MEFRFVFIICNLFSTYLLFRYLNLFFDRKETNIKTELVAFTIFYCIDTSLFLLNMPILISTTNYIISVFLLSFIYKCTIKKRVVSVALIFLAIFGIEALVYILTGYLEVSFFTKNYYSSISGLIILQIFSLVVLILLSRFFDLKLDLPLPYKSWIFVFLLPVFSIYIILLVTQIDISLHIEAVVGMIALLFMNFAIFYLYQSILSSVNKSVENERIRDQNESYLKQLEIMKNSSEAKAGLEHDLIHKLFSIKALLIEGRIEQSIGYIDRYLEVIENQEIFSTTGNFVFDSILNYQLSLARQRNIEPLLLIMLPTELEVDPPDISSLLGNLLDNAMNAVEKLECDRWIEINIKCEKGLLIIKIRNPYLGEISTSNGKILTSKANGKNHGIGLKNIDAIINKYDGVINFQTDSNIFQVDLLLVLD